MSCETYGRLVVLVERGRKMELKVKGLKKEQTAAIIFLIGLIIGGLFANLMKKYYLSDMRVLDYTYQSILSNQELDYISLLKYALLNNLKEFALFWILCLTIIGIPYICIAICYKGIQAGFLISSVIMIYGSKGILLFFSYLLPQALIYVPVMLICLQKGFTLAQHSFYRSRNRSVDDKTSALGYAALILVLLILLFLGAVVETYFGSAVLRKTLELCV